MPGRSSRRETPTTTITPVDLIMPDGAVVPGEFRIWDWDPSDWRQVRLELHFASRELIRSEVDYWHALLAVREVLDAEGILLRCYGASRNVHPSGMCLDMGRGVKAYRLFLGQTGRVRDLVSIWDAGADLEPATVEEQADFYKEWLSQIPLSEG